MPEGIVWHLRFVDRKAPTSSLAAIRPVRWLVDTIFELMQKAFCKFKTNLSIFVINLLSIFVLNSSF